jgi:Family of unknown function (DUF6151)
MNIAIECDCGALTGTVNAKNLSHCRAICLCDDCQAYAHYLQRADVLDANGGTDVYPVTPARIQITKGLEHLQCVRLNPKGMYRWYAGCCKTPIGNTMSSPAFSYVGMVGTVLKKKNSQEVLDRLWGPMLARIQGQFGIGELPPGTLRTASPGFLLRVLRFIALSLIRHEKRPSPFFDSAGEPRAKVSILTKQERDSLRPLCGTKRIDL